MSTGRGEKRASPSSPNRTGKEKAAAVMRGDSILIEPHHRKAAEGIASLLRPVLEGGEGRIGVTIAGESGSGKSETAAALAEALAAQGIESVIFQQDDYFVYPPKTNDRTRRADIGWVGPQEVRLDLMNAHMRAFLDGATSIEKPLVDYEEDAVHSEIMETGSARVAIAEGTYTTLLEAAGHRAFIDRDYTQTRKHREKRNRDASELDAFIDNVLEIEHKIISAQKVKADIIVNPDYSVSPAP
jgi:uridine kinase